MVHHRLLLTHWISLLFTSPSYGPTDCLFGTLLSSTDPLDISMVHYPLLLVTGSLYGTLLSSTGPLNISLVCYPLLFVQWLYLWYTPIFYGPTGYPCGTLSSLISPLIIPMIHCYLLLTTGYLYGTLSFPIGPLAIPMLHCYLLLTLRIFLWYTSFLLLAHWLSLCTLLFSNGQLDISMVHYPLLLAHWLS